MAKISETDGRSAFGANAQAFAESRPAYPAWMFDVLCQEGILYPSALMLEVGSGSGLATRALVERGISKLTMVEPDERFADYLRPLREQAGDDAQIVFAAFEDAELSKAPFDAILVATAFHWLEPQTRAHTLAHLTKPGGSVVLIWNVFQDMNLEDPFHEATKDLLAELSDSPSGKHGMVPFALDRAARETEFLSTGCFETQLYLESHWQVALIPEEIRSLYEGFSQIARLPEAERETLLDRIEAIAKTEFAGKVTRNITSPLYAFRRIQ